MTIAASGREHRDARDADVFSWNELPELLAAEDLFDTCATACEPLTADASSAETVWAVADDRLVAARDDEDEDEDDDDFEDEDEDEDEDYEDDDEEEDEDEDEEDDDDD